MIFIVFNYRILNYKIILELLRYRIGFGHRSALHLEIVKALLSLVMGLSGIGVVVRWLGGDAVVIHCDVDILHHMFNITASKVVDLVEEIVIVFNIISSVIAIVCVYYLGAALIIQMHVAIGSLNYLRSRRLLFDI